MVLKVKIAVAGYPIACKGKKLEAALKWLAEHDLHEELQFSHNIWMKPKIADEAKDLIKSLGIDVSVHAPYYINLANPAKAKASKKRILDCCDMVKRFGGTIVVFHAGYYGKQDKEKIYDIMVKACKEMARKTSVLLGPETTSRESQFGTLDELVQLSKEVKGCVPVVDFAHIYARAGGKIDYGEVFNKMKKFKHIHSHFTGVDYKRPGDAHLPISSKKPNFAPLAKEIKKRKLNITIVNESPYLEKDALLMKKYFKK